MATGCPPSTQFPRKKDNRSSSPFPPGTMLVRVKLVDALVIVKARVLVRLDIRTMYALLLSQCDAGFPGQHSFPRSCGDFGLWVASILQLCFHLHHATSRSPWKGEMRNRGNSLALKCTVNQTHHFYFKFIVPMYSCGGFQPNVGRWGFVGEPTNIWGT